MQNNKLEDLYNKAFGGELINEPVVQTLMAIFVEEVLIIRKRMTFPRRILKRRKLENHERLVINGKRANTWILQAVVRFARDGLRAGRSRRAGGSPAGRGRPDRIVPGRVQYRIAE